jgi:hypothetical protein
MKRTLIALISILITISSFGAEKAWQVTLRNELRVATSNIFCGMPVLAGWRMHYTVPASAAAILESRTFAELSPFLAGLHVASEPANHSIIEQWRMIAREGLRGTPSVITTVSGTATQELRVFQYSVSVHKQKHESTKP